MPQAHRAQKPAAFQDVLINEARNVYKGVHNSRPLVNVVTMTNFVMLLPAELAPLKWQFLIYTSFCKGAWTRSPKMRATGKDSEKG